MSRVHLERSLQQDICAQLVAQGWAHSPKSAGYDAVRALYPADVLAWIETSDPKNYASLIKPDADPATRQAQEKQLLDRLVTKLSAPEEQGGGTLNVLRKGFSIPGARRPFQLIAYPPQDKRNPDLTALYQRNILRVVEEVRYNPADESARIDLVLFINGLPVATIELKSEYTQTIQDAIKQYRTSRDPKTSPLLQGHRGALVHFALSQDQIAMTTKPAPTPSPDLQPPHPRQPARLRLHHRHRRPPNTRPAAPRRHQPSRRPTRHDRRSRPLPPTRARAQGPVPAD